MRYANYKNLSVKEWIDVLGENPELESICDKFDDFSDFDWLELFQKPLFSIKFDENRANYAHTCVQILKNHPEFALKCKDWHLIAKCSYIGVIDMEYLSLFAIRDQNIIDFVGKESFRLMDEIRKNIQRIKNSEVLKYIFKNAIPMPEGILTSIYDKVNFDDILRLSLNNKDIINKCEFCGCYNYGHIFSPNNVKNFIGLNEEQTARCPFCGTDSVIPPTEKFPITKENLFLLGTIAFGSGCEIKIDF